MSLTEKKTRSPSREETKHRSSSTGKSAKGSHAANAERFIQMCNALDSILTSYQRIVPNKQSQNSYPQAKIEEPYLITHLKSIISNAGIWETKTRTGISHKLVPLRGDGRRDIPSTIMEALQKEKEAGSWLSDGKKEKKVPLTWLVCYLHNRRPNMENPRWEFYDCSHVCCCRYEEKKQEEFVCVSIECLTWESKSDNQERGNKLCMKACVHDGCQWHVCRCQRFHQPPCH